MKNKLKEEIATEQQILYNLVQILDMFPQYTVAQHLWHVLRTKGNPKEPYFWTNKELLSRIEAYYNEVTEDLLDDSDTE